MNNATCETCQRKQGTTNVALDEFYLKNHLGSTVAVMDNGAVSTLKAAYDYRATMVAMRTKQQVAKCCPPFGEQVTLSEPTEKVTENFTGKEKDDETELNYFGARYLDPMLGLWISVDPKRQFSSPYLYAGNGVNSIGAIDPDGNETIINLSGDNVVLNMTYNAEGNNLVKFNNANGTSFTANEPPSRSYFYSKNNEGRYKIEGQSFDVNMQANADEMLDQAFDAWPADFGCWRSGGALDFKNAYYKGAENTVGIVNGTAMTARDAGNAMWGGWVNTMYPMPKPAMNFISDVVAGGKEDASSAVMQNWGYDNYKP